ncbi:MAG: EAL domain-containing protein, partial [Rubrivivax sp.]
GLIDVASQLVLELTERGLPDLLALDGINHGRSRGIRVALDDVTLQGGANVAVLARANVDIIKLDKALVAQIGPETPHPPWLDDMAALIRAPRLTVIAEGVETLQQLHTLQDAGLQVAQGYWFSRPLEARAVIDYYRASQDSGEDFARRPAAGR